jgi:hypothetical protein
MIIDTLLTFADGQTVTGGTTTEATDNIDLASLGSAAAGLGALSRAIGTGRPLYCVITVGANSGGDGSDTFQFSLVTDTVLPTDGSSRVIASSPVVTGAANLPAGTKVVIPVPAGVQFDRYVGLRYAVTATAVLVVDAFLTDDQTYDHTTYPAGDEGVTV